MYKGIAFAGNLIVDYIKYIETYPAENTLTSIKSMERSSGGLVCNCVMDIAKLDPSVPVKAIGVIGDDEAGDYIISRLCAFASVDASRIARRGTSSYTDVMTGPDGSRTFFQHRGANSLLTPDCFDFSNLEADILHIGYILLLDGLDCADSQYPTAMCRVLDGAQKAGIETSVDVVSENSGRFSRIVPPALAYTDYCIINEIEASKTTGIPLRDESNATIIGQNMPKACARLMDMGVKKWVVIHAPELACGMERGGGFIQERSWKIPRGFKKSSVGAGDAFASGILYSAYKGWGLQRAINIAGAVAAYSLSGSGACDSIEAFGSLMEKMKAFQLEPDAGL